MGRGRVDRASAPWYADRVRLAIVHHTAGTNSYTAAQSAAIVRGIQRYHVLSNGWNDIGYNFLVDKYGQVFEGRAGGIDQPVGGAHAAGFNTGSAGIAVLGTYSGTDITSSARSALVKLISWRLDVAHVDPLKSLTYSPSEATSFRRDLGAPPGRLRPPRYRFHELPGQRSLRTAGRSRQERRGARSAEGLRAGRLRWSRRVRPHHREALRRRSRGP